MTPPSPFDVGSSTLDVRCSPFADRLLTLSTGQPGLRSTVTVETRAPSSEEIKNQNSKIENPDATVLDFVASDETLDRYSEIISVSGWRLDTYRRNPVFQNSHQYGDIIFTLGKALLTEIREVGRGSPSPPSGPVLFQRIQFAVDANPMARIAYNLYKGKFLNAVSVGFIPIRWEDASSSSSSSSSDQPCRRRYLEQELLEVSAVGIPANPNALALAYKSGALVKSDIQETIDLLSRTISSPVKQAPIIPIPPITPITLSLLRQLHSILRS